MKKHFVTYNDQNRDSMDKEEIKQIAYDFTTSKDDAKKLEDRILSLFLVSKSVCGYFGECNFKGRDNECKNEEYCGSKKTVC